MSKFCIYCGKPLEEGMVCDCPQAQAEKQTQKESTIASMQPAPAPQPKNSSKNEYSKAISPAIKSLGGLFTKPVEALTEYVQQQNFIVGIILILIQAVFVSAFTLTTAGFNIKIWVLFLLIVLAFIMSIVVTGFLYGILFGLTALFKGNKDPKAMICMVSVYSLVIIPFLVVGTAAGIFSTSLAFNILFIGQIFAMSYLYLAVKLYTGIKVEKLVIMMPIAVAVFYIIYQIVSVIFGKIYVMGFGFYDFY